MTLSYLLDRTSSLDLGAGLRRAVRRSIHNVSTLSREVDAARAAASCKFVDVLLFSLLRTSMDDTGLDATSMDATRCSESSRNREEATA